MAKQQKIKAETHQTNMSHIKSIILLGSAAQEDGMKR
jgi:hypothetical protein